MVPRNSSMLFVFSSLFPVCRRASLPIALLVACCWRLLLLLLVFPRKIGPACTALPEKRRKGGIAEQPGIPTEQSSKELVETLQKRNTNTRKR